MTWWAWTLVFLAVAVLGAVVIFVQARSLWRKASALLGDLADVSDQVAQITARLDELAPAPDPVEPAVFSRPADLRRTGARRSR